MGQIWLSGQFKNDFIWPVEERFQRHKLDSHTEAGQLDTGDRIAKMFKRASKRAGLEPTYSIHDLRHTCASLLINNNCNVKTVRRPMRHATATEPLNTYSHFWNEKGLEAVEVLSKAVAGKTQVKLCNCNALTIFLSSCF